jgi:hypothetical protein
MERSAGTASVCAHFRTHRERIMDEMSWKQRGLVLLSILVMTLIGLAINNAPAAVQTGVRP